MAFQLIDIDLWKRREFYLHYMNNTPCTYSVTADIDITGIKTERLYPAMLWLLTCTVNEFEEFRTALLPEGLGIFDSMNPSYTVFNRKNENFSVIWTPFCSDYSEFLHQYEIDTEKYRSSEELFPKKTGLQTPLMCLCCPG